MPEMIRPKMAVGVKMVFEKVWAWKEVRNIWSSIVNKAVNDTVITNIQMNNNTRNPLTAVPIVSITVLPNLPCLYREFLCVWCHFMISYRERAVYKIAQPLIGQFCLPCWVTWQLFILNDLIGPNEVTWPKSFVMQFSTSFSSSGGIIFFKKKTRVFLYKNFFN